MVFKPYQKDDTTPPPAPTVKWRDMSPILTNKSSKPDLNSELAMTFIDKSIPTNPDSTVLGQLGQEAEDAVDLALEVRDKFVASSSFNLSSDFLRDILADIPKSSTLPSNPSVSSAAVPGPSTRPVNDADWNVW